MIFSVLFAALLLLGTGLCEPVDTLEARGFSCPASIKRKGCLTDDDMNSILSRWPQLFNRIYSGKQLETITNCTAAADIGSVDKTFTFGRGGRGVIYSSRAELIRQNQLAYDKRNVSPVLPEGRYSTTFAFHSCDRIAWRWQFNGKTSGLTNGTHTTNTVRGKPVVYYGVDLLRIKPGTNLIEYVDTSGDWFNEYFATGRSFDGRSICSGTKSAKMAPD